MQDDDSKIALAEEHIVVSKHLQAAEALRVHTVVHTDEQVVATPVTREQFDVTRVPLDRWVEAPIPERQEGDTRIVTLHAEVVVTETRLKAIEEVRITRRRDTRETTERVTVRREEAVLERIPAPVQAPQEELSGRCSRSDPIHQPASMELEFMTTTIISTVDNAKAGTALIAELVKAGLEGSDVEVLEGDHETIMSEIVGRGFDESDARGYLEAVEGGKSLVAARAAEDQIEGFLAIMERYEASDDQAGEADGEKLLEVEEELAIAKSKVAQGGVRVSRSVSEQPVEETVTVRTETVGVDHQAVDRELSAEEAGAAFKDKTLEMIGTTEEVAVTKEARVVGEVSLTKQASEHEQKVHETVRRTHVDVEQIGANAPNRE